MFINRIGSWQPGTPPRGHHPGGMTGPMAEPRSKNQGEDSDGGEARRAAGGCQGEPGRIGASGGLGAADQRLDSGGPSTSLPAGRIGESVPWCSGPSPRRESCEVAIKGAA
jgi:hypothetical protein